MTSAVDDYLEACRQVFRSQRKLAERAISQLDDTQLRSSGSGEENSVAIIMKHMAGNMISRWTDFLTTDGEKPWRDRDSEFVDDFPDRAAVEAHWNRGWSCLLETLDGLGRDDLSRQVTIRGEPHSVIEALQRQLSHYGYHVGQIVTQARQLRGSSWKNLSIPRGASEQFNRGMGHSR